MKKKRIILDFKTILIIILLVIIIGMCITYRLVWKYHYNAIPSHADLKYGLAETFKDVDKLECEYFGKFKYGSSKLTYKYTCSFEYKTKEEDKKEAKTCVECDLKGKKWHCSISTSECFK